MPKYCGILVYYNNGEEEFFYGGLHVDEKVLKIWPVKDTCAISIPLASIKKYIATGGAYANSRNQVSK